MSHQIIESPAISFPSGHRAVIFGGKIMRPSTAAKVLNLEPHLRAAAAEGLTMTQIARRIGYCVITVREWATMLGVPVPGKRNCPTPHDTSTWGPIVEAGLKAGLTQEEIGAKLNVHSMQIHRYCRRNNLSWRRAKRFSR